MSLSYPKDLGSYTLERFACETWAGTVSWGKETRNQSSLLCLSIETARFPSITREIWLALFASLGGIRLLHDPNILPCYDLENDLPHALHILYRTPQPPPNRPANLYELLQARRYGGLTERDALSALEQIVGGLATLHAQGYLLGTLHPATLWVDWTEQPLRLRISHYGLSTLLQHHLPTLSITSPFLLQQSSFLAPELLPNHEASSPPSIEPHHDLYSVGTLLRWMLAPYPTQESNHPPIRPSINALHPITQRLLQRLLHPSPQKRYRQSHQLALWLKEQPWSEMPQQHATAEKKDAITLSYEINETHPTQEQNNDPSENSLLLNTLLIDTSLPSLSLQNSTLLFKTEELTAPIARVRVESPHDEPPSSLLATLPMELTPSAEWLAYGSAPLEELPSEILPSPIPESWEKEALAHDQSFAPKKRPLLLNLLGLFPLLLLAWLLWRILTSLL